MVLDLYSKSRKPKTLSRQELYDLVWSKPMRDLAKDFDLSDQGLAKKCKRHNIPRSPQGYWLKSERGRKRLVKPLPPNDDPSLETIDFFPKPESLSQSIKAKSTLVDEELKAAVEFRFPEKVHRYHPAIAKCRNPGKKVSHDRYSRMVFGPHVVNPGIKVTPVTFDRACRFLQGIINLFDAYSWKFKLANCKACFTFNGNEVEYEVIERVTKKEVPDKNPHSGLDALFWKRRDYESTGFSNSESSSFTVQTSKSTGLILAIIRLRNSLPASFRDSAVPLRQNGSGRLKGMSGKDSGRVKKQSARNRNGYGKSRKTGESTCLVWLRNITKPNQSGISSPPWRPQVTGRTVWQHGLNGPIAWSMKSTRYVRRMRS